MKLLQTLSQPKQFKEILDKLISSSNRVVLSSLYLGHDLNKGTVMVDGQRARRSPLKHNNTWYYNTNNYRKLLPFHLGELGELYHCKVYIFDNSVVLSGANLSHDYYTNRQDRYYIVNNHHFADTMDNMMALMRETNLFNENIISVNKINKKVVEDLERQQIFQLKKLKSALGNKVSGTQIIPILNWPRVGLAFNIIQFLQNYYHDSQFTISTAYFNPDSSLAAMIQNQAKVIVPSIQCHGFYGGKGLKKHVPMLYQHLVNQHQVYTYNRPNYTFHAKGIWIEDGNHLLTVIGSNNYGARSTKDVELDFILYTDDKDMKLIIKEELNQLLQFCNPRIIEPVPKWIQLWSILSKRLL